MGDRDRFLLLSFGGRRLAPTVVACGIGATLLLSLGAGALAAGGTNVVPPKGKVAGKGYAYWLERSWQRFLGRSPPANPCQTLTANGQRVGYLTLKTTAPGTDKYICGEPARRAMYVVGLSNECSTFQGDHNGFGTTPAALKRCARTGFKGARVTTTVDGHPVEANTLNAATGVYPVHVPKKNIFNAKPGSGQSAAYGSGLLLTGFSKGSHTIHSLWSVGSAKWDITFTVHAH
jgi:hypothetical protein